MQALFWKNSTMRGLDKKRFIQKLLEKLQILFDKLMQEYFE